MQTSSRYSRRNIYLLRILVLTLIAVTVYALSVLQKSEQTYAGVSEMIAQQATVSNKKQLGNVSITIPSYDLFKSGNIWALVSKENVLKTEANRNLVDIPVEHGDADIPIKIANEISDELQQLVNAADASGEPLMVSSAYRSLDEQRELYKKFVEENGVAIANQYVLPAGASEHHTGLSVDFASLSDECADDSDTCSLSQSSAAWLAANAYRFGFILRYPEGGQSITGVRFEPWHYRFIGKPLASAMFTTDLTYEEVVTVLAPGYVKTK